MTGLTRKQAELLAFIRRCIVARGAAPTTAEMVAHMGYAYHGAALRLLDCLEEAGHIRRQRSWAGHRWRCGSVELIRPAA